jgi:hypothetical protein
VYKSKDLTVRLGEEGRVVSNKEFKVIVIKWLRLELIK